MFSRETFAMQNLVIVLPFSMRTALFIYLFSKKYCVCVLLQCVYSFLTNKGSHFHDFFRVSTVAMQLPCALLPSEISLGFGFGVDVNLLHTEQTSLRKHKLKTNI